MAIKTKAELRELFKTGATPTGQSFSDLIQTIISQVNDNQADENGAVRTSFNIIEPIRADVKPSEYPMGTTEFITEFDKSEYEDYIATYPSLDKLSNGSIAVRTFRDVDGMCLQQVDNVADGKFVAAFYRICLASTDEWLELTQGTNFENFMGNLYDFTSSEFFEFDGQTGNLNLTNIANQLIDSETLTVNNNGKLVVTETGGRGPQGERGEMGPQGEQGERGIPGVAGPQGIAGSTGAKGDPGEPGPQGAMGLTGATGSEGPRGRDGVAGPQGIQGATGETGPQGDVGPMGDSFKVVKSYATVEELNNDFNNPLIEEGAFVIISSDTPDTDEDNARVYVKGATEYRYIATFRGIRGERGPQGYQGLQGMQGERGIQGPQGIQGFAGSQGPRGEQGPPGINGRGIENLGTAELLTEDKTVYGSINEVFLSGNNVKNQTVNALLSRHLESTVTNESSWSDIQRGIRDIPSGGVNGRQVMYRQLQSEPLSLGDFGKVFTIGNQSIATLTATDVNNTFHRFGDAVPIGKNRILTANNYDTTNGYITIRLLEVKNNVVTTVSSLNVNTSAGIGDAYKLAKLSDIHVGIVHNKQNSAGFLIRSIYINGNVLSISSGNKNISNSTNEMYGVSVANLVPDKMVYVASISGNISIRACRRDTSDTSGVVLESNYQIVPGNSNMHTNVSVVRRTDTHVYLVVSYASGGTNDILSYVTLTYNIANANFTVNSPGRQLGTSTESLNQSSRSHKVYGWSYKGKHYAIFMYNNSFANNILLMARVELDNNNNVIEGTRIVMSMSEIAGSGYASYSGSVQQVNHTAEFISDHEMTVIFRANDNMVRSVTINLEDMTSKDLHVLFNGNNFVHHLVSVRTNDYQFVYRHSNSASTSNGRRIAFSCYQPYTLARNSIEGDTIAGVVTGVATYPNEIELTRPLLT